MRVIRMSQMPANQWFSSTTPLSLHDFAVRSGTAPRVARSFPTYGQSRTLDRRIQDSNPPVETTVFDPNWEAAVPRSVRDQVRSQILPENWDGEGASAVTEAAARAALTFLGQAWRACPDLPCPVFVNATVLGGIGCFWKSRGWKILIEIGPAGGGRVYRQSVDPYGAHLEGYLAGNEAITALKNL